jgi:hypothetical protein
MFKNTSRPAALGFLTVVASGNMSRRMYRWTLGLLLTGALAATAMPAMAQTPVTTFLYGGASNFDFPCFGYKGHFRGGTYIAEVDWGGFSECFGIAPDGTIWHAWRNSGVWQQMPDNVRADHISFAYRDRDGHRGIAVEVHEDHLVTLYESTYGSFWDWWVPFAIYYY